ncbi:MAG TPA: hypothetical protein VLA19_12445 [Herpetosiphonaceae bacterium]|nr:hypothetical protein [Herpetosiphonaceae bacterium]
MGDTLTGLGLLLVVLAFPLMIVGARVRTDLGQFLIFFGIVVILTGVFVFAMGLITVW